MRLKYSLLTALGITCALGMTAYTLSKYKENEKQQAFLTKQTEFRQSLRIAEGLINRKHPVRALDLLRNEEPNLQFFPELQPDWVRLAAKSAVMLNDDKLLQSLYKFRPDLIETHEELSLKLAQTALSSDHLSLYQLISEKWRDRARFPSKWLLLEADALALNNQLDLSAALLNSQTLQNEDEVTRLLKLAILSQNQHPQIAWEYLTKALKLAPNSQELHYFRAKLLQSSDRNDLARTEYKIAMLNQPQQIFYKEEYVQFCLEHQLYSQAFEVLQHSLQEPTSDRLWLSALFLHKVYKPFSLAFSQFELPQGDLKLFLRYLLALQPNETWNSTLIHSQPQVADLASKLPEGLWLKVMGYLDAGLEIKAYKILKLHPEMAKLNPDLYDGLQIVIAYRYPHLNLPETSEVSRKRDSHIFIKELKRKAYSKENQKLLNSSDIYPALFLATGWNESALKLHRNQEMPADFPKWVAVAMARAITTNRNSKEALEFAKKQTESPQLHLMLGELELKAGHLSNALVYLNPFLKENSKMGERAVFLLSSYYVTKNNYGQAVKIITDNQSYVTSVSGKEQLAAIALKQGNLQEAQKIYQSIATQSSTAVSFLAAKAYKDSDYPLALELIQKLLQDHPDQIELQKQRQLLLSKIKRD